MSRQPAHTQQIRLDRGHPRRAARAHKARHRGRVADVGGEPRARKLKWQSSC